MRFFRWDQDHAARGRSRRPARPTAARTTWCCALLFVCGALPVHVWAQNVDSLLSYGLDFARQQVAASVHEVADPSRFPRATATDGSWITKSAGSWTSGFFPGCLWFMFESTGADSFRTSAELWTQEMEDEQNDTGSHDVGFKMLGSFGQGFRLTGNAAYPAVLLQGAQSLATRYNSVVGCIRSWNNRNFPVIIDNMMNLELLFWGAANGGDPTWYDMAVSHATRTMQDHVRADGSTYQIVDYDPSTGTIIAKEAHQGYDVESTWARGQAWALYGFTMAYRETGNVAFLQTAQQTANYFIANLPADHVPYWDFDAPNIPNEERDTSAASIAASGLLELSTLTADSLQGSYRNAAIDILVSLSSSSYLATGSNSSGVLLHAVGNRPNGTEVDVSLIYADYYYLEALLRYQGIASDVGDVFAVPLHPALRAYPNPFNPGTTLHYSIAEAAHVHLAIFDVRGQRVAVLVDEHQAGGAHQRRWTMNAVGLRRPSGVYFARLQTADRSVVSKLVLLR
jgi:unsaturated chondroitin disaccharide hydrolase